MSRVAFAAALLTVALAVPAHADARDYKWRVSGSITGTYSNSVSAYNCYETRATATFAEQVSVNVKLLPRFTSTWTPGSRFGAKLRLAVGGEWRVTGTFPPRHLDPVTGEPSCGPPEDIDCKGAVELDGTGRTYGADFVLDPYGRTMRGDFVSFDGFAESAVLRRLPGLEICNPYRESGEQFTGPLWGLGSTSIESDTHTGTIIKFPARKLSGRKAFTFTGKTAKPDPDECEAIQWIACTQSGAMVMKLRFTPAKR